MGLLGLFLIAVVLWLVIGCAALMSDGCCERETGWIFLCGIFPVMVTVR